MSVHVIYYKDGAKMMRPVLSREEYLRLRGSEEQQRTLKAVREGDSSLKSRLVQMNYSCLPNDDGSLKGSKTASTTVGMDVDFNAPECFTAEEQQGWLKEQMAKVPELVMGKKDALGLLMLERSATKGYHLVFRRRQALSQEENLKWASDLLGMKYDKGAKDITRVFFTTTAAPEELIFLDDEVFEIRGCEIRGYEGAGVRGRENSSCAETSADSNLVPSASAEAVPSCPRQVPPHPRQAPPRPRQKRRLRHWRRLTYVPSRRD